MPIVKCLHCKKNFSIQDKEIERLKIVFTPQPDDPTCEEEIEWLNCQLEQQMEVASKYEQRLQALVIKADKAEAEIKAKYKALLDKQTAKLKAQKEKGSDSITQAELAEIEKELEWLNCENEYQNKKYMDLLKVNRELRRLNREGFNLMDWRARERRKA